MKCISQIKVTPSAEYGSLMAPCGKCIYCLNNKRNEWSFRLWMEQKRSLSSYFVTLTYKEAPIKEFTDPLTDSKYYSESLHKPDLQNFIKALRERQRRFIKMCNQNPAYKNYKQSDYKITYYAVGEYGTKTTRPHYHIILFNAHPDIMRKSQEVWDKGYLQIGEVNPASIRYTTKYVINKPDWEHNGDKPFAIMSKNPPIGSNYMKAMQYHRDNKTLSVTDSSGNKIPLPRYFKEKFFTPQEREIIADNLVREALEYKDEKRQKHNAKNTKPFFERSLEAHEKSIEGFNRRNKKNTF